MSRQIFWGEELKEYPYTDFENNGLFVVPAEGANAGQVIQIASAPNDAEFTGVYFQKMKKLFSCQSNTQENLVNQQAPPTSHWPSRI